MVQSKQRFRHTPKCFAAVVIVASIACLAAAQPQPASAYRILVPEGYVGWIRIDFDIAGAAPLSTEEGFYIFKIPKTGRFQTSSRDLLDSRRNEFFYYSDETKYRLRQGGPPAQQLVQVEQSGPGPDHREPVPNRYRYIFIGPTDVFKEYQAADHSKEPTESDGYQKVGPMYWLSRDELNRMNVRRP